LAYLDGSAARYPEATAVEDPGTGRAISYAQLDRLSGRLRDRLARLGVEPGDRVGFCLDKSIDSIACIFGIMKAGAAYVPTDPGAPLSRNAMIFNDCAVRAIVTSRDRAEPLAAEMATLGDVPTLLITGEGDAARLPLAVCLDREAEREPAPAVASHRPGPDELAYILYTSGSTGRPKGVMLTHRNAASYVDWCSQTFQPTSEDRFSSHAPLHFDLSILDVYVPLAHGATLVLIPEALGKDPIRLAPLIAERRITCWYSTPSILALLAQYGKLDQLDLSALRIVNFAGEVFPIKHLRALHELLPAPRYFNLYGPTETNVCTYFELPAEIPEDRKEPFPIGVTCSHCECRVVDEHGRPVEPGAEGELLVRGAPVTSGYWNLPERSAEAFLTDDEGRSWYRTGDLVIEDEAGNYVFQGRRDRMIKKRGYRIELGEIESCLYRHPQIEEAAAVATSSEQSVRVTAFLTLAGEERPSIIELKTFCSERLPSYMIPDRFVVQERLPRTSTDKVDYQALKASA
ncbi:MAG: amino acid adenylation domain-containing protein, partial [Thermoanaerobaculia bacterium]|nr:amino acid adenylation domain-containing protein [Thermoanaerobaculia bacterium]